MKLLDQVDLVGRRLRLSPNTIDAYSSWIRGFLAFCCGWRGQWTHPTQLGTSDVEAFLNDLVLRRRLSASSQNQALNALVFLYKHVLHQPMEEKIEAMRASRPKRLPVVLSREETHRILGALEGTFRLIAQLMYGSGLRLKECLRLRVKDLDFDRKQVTVRAGKGDKDRWTVDKAFGLQLSAVGCI